MCLPKNLCSAHIQSIKGCKIVSSLTFTTALFMSLRLHLSVSVPVVKSHKCRWSHNLITVKIRFKLTKYLSVKLVNFSSALHAFLHGRRSTMCRLWGCRNWTSLQVSYILTKKNLILKFQELENLIRFNYFSIKIPNIPDHPSITILYFRAITCEGCKGFFRRTSQVFHAENEKLCLVSAQHYLHLQGE